MDRFLGRKRLIKRILTFPFRFGPSRYGGIRILMYHRVNDEAETELAVSNRQFGIQMGFLSCNTKVISLEEAVQLIKSNEPIQEDYFVLTFDDGYEDFYYNAFPVLKQLNLPAKYFCRQVT